MSHKTTPVAPGRQIIARRKGSKVRLFDTAKATMGKWTTDPMKARQAAPALRKIAQRDAQAATAEVIAPGKSREVKVAALQAVAEANYRSMTVPALRAILFERHGLKPTTRTKKDALVHTLVELSIHK